MITVAYGIDPGLTGAVAVVWTQAGELGGQVVDLPTVVRAGTRGGNQLDALGLRDIVSDWTTQYGSGVWWVEQQGPMPRQGVRSVYSLGHTSGVIEAVLALQICPRQMVSPASWKRCHGVTSDKRTSRTLAMERWPQLYERLRRVADHGRAEALLIALYGLQQRLPAAAA